MSIFQNIQKMLEKAQNSSQTNNAQSGPSGLFGGKGATPPANPLGALSALFGGATSGSSPLDSIGKALGGKSSSSTLGTAALGALVGALITSKTGRNAVGGALLVGGGSLLWNKYKDRIQQTNEQSNADYGKSPSSTRDHAERILRALIYAIKSDGHIDDKERAALQEQLAQLNLGDDGENIVNAALNEPLDPNNITTGVNSAEEALEIYTISCAATAGTNVMERSYLEALAKALGIPDDVKQSIEAKARGESQE